MSAATPASPCSTRWPVNRWGAIAVVLAAILVWAVLPTAPNYDTATHLVWAHEIADGRMPDVKAPFSPTLHPLWLVASFVAEDSGGGAALLQLVALLAFGVVIACAYRLAADVAGWIAGTIAALSTGSSFALLLLAFKAYVDLPFLAVVLTAMVVERSWTAGQGPGSSRAPWVVEGVERRRRFAAFRGRGFVMPVLMFVAGLLRPEAWAIGLLLLALRLVPRGGGEAASAAPGAGANPGEGAAAPRAAVRDLVLPALIVIAAPILWSLCDLALTGDPLHSLTGTQALAEELSRKTGLVAAPKQLILQLSDLARPPIAAGGVLGVILAVRFLGWRPLVVPLATLLASAAGFLLIGALGLPLLQRYLELPAVLLCSFAGAAGAIVIAAARGRSVDTLLPAQLQDGASAAPPSPALRATAAAVLAVGVLGAGGYLALKANSFRIVGKGVLQEGEWQREGAALLGSLHVKERKGQCGPVTLPTYRFVPELTLASHLDEGDVVSRATQLGGSGPQAHGIAITIGGNHAAKERLGWAQGVPRTTNVIPPGFTVVAKNGPFIAAQNCPG